MSDPFDKEAVLASFVEEVNSYLPEIEANLACLAQSPRSKDALEETYRRTHTIGGSASMMDFPGLAHVAHGMEDILSDVLEGLAPLEPPTLALLQRSFGRINRLVHGIHKGVDEMAIMAEDDADYAQYRSIIESADKQQEQRGRGEPYPYANKESADKQNAQQEQPSSRPSLDEMLLSFRTPTSIAGSDIAWPENPAPLSIFQAPIPPAQASEHANAWGALIAGYSPAPQPAMEPQEGRGEPYPYVTPSPQPAMEYPPTPQPSMEYPSTPEPATEYSPAPQPAMEYPSAPQPAPEPLPTIEYRPEPLPTTEYSPSPQPAMEYSLISQEGRGEPQEGRGEPYPYATPLPQPAMEYPPTSQSASEPLPTIEYRPESLPTTDQPQETALTTGETSFSSIYNEMQEEAHALEVQAISFRSTLTQLQMAVSLIEAQHTEFAGFLDGSKDALDRMEEWAGRAMGLNLRKSPEQVRRYLPLSVMWVTNSKLKKVLDLLNPITTSTATTDEQVPLLLQQLRTSIEACAGTFQRLQTDQYSRTLKQEPGWTPWEMRVSREAEAVQERVTFERSGDPLALRAEIEAQVREELHHEYEARLSALTARAELEQQIRNEVFQELQVSRQQQQHALPSENSETPQEIEARVRREMELQVRHEFLSQLVEDMAEKKAANTSLSSPSEPATQSAPTSTSMPLYIAADIGEEAAAIFRLEAEECLQTISIGVTALEKSPTDGNLIQGIRRTTHTLKGAASMMGFRAIADLCHVSEDLLDSVINGATTISSPVLSLFLDTTEALDMLINPGEAEHANVGAMLQSLRSRYIDLLGHTQVREELDTDDEALSDSTLRAGVVSDAQPTDTKRSDLSVRVRLQKLDELVSLFGELLVNRSILKERIEHLVALVADVTISSSRLRDVGQKLETRFESPTFRRDLDAHRGAGGVGVEKGPSWALASDALAPMSAPFSVQAMSENGSQSAFAALMGNRERMTDDPNGPPHLAEFDELEFDRYTEFHQITRGLSEGIADMTTLSNEMEAVIRECESVFARENRLSATLQDNLLRARLVPLSVMIPRLYRTARSVALKQHKEVEFLLEGDTTEVDRTVSEEIAGPLLHLVRNAVHHAIETPEVRNQKGKPPVGLIKLSAAYEANQVVITVRDDGTGIDPEGVRQAAIARGLIGPDRVLTDTEVIDLIFLPGFSTAAVLSEEGGRGVGLDVVRDSVTRLKGTLSVESMPGQGTAFTMRFPTSLAIQSAILVGVSGQQFAIPMLIIESISRLDNFNRSTLAGQPAIVVRDQLYPLTTLAQFLKLPPGPIDAKNPLLLVNVGGRKVALIVNQVKGKMDVVMKDLGPHLRHVRGIAGGTTLGNGRVVLMLELMELLSSRSGTVGSTTVSAWREDSIPPLYTPKHILVVDDSPSVRRVVSDMLKQHGWQVQTARDGAEALEMITHETPAAVLLDIEMPRMDGYELMATVRAQVQYQTLPLVILTSRAASKHQQHAMQLGANACLVKPYQDEELINTLNTLVYGASRYGR